MNDTGADYRRHFADAIDVRPMDVNDIASVRRLQISSFLALTSADLTPAAAIAFQTRVVSDAYTRDRYRATQRQELLGAIHDGRLIGTVEWGRPPNDNRTARIRGIFVDPLFTNCSVGTRLLHDVERHIEHIGLTKIATRCTLSAIGFFERFGYHITAHGQRPISPSQALAIVFLRKEMAPIAAAIPEA